MLCQACGTNTANTHIKTTVNGELTERHLCAQCASKMGYNSLFGGLNMGSLIASFFGNPSVVGLPVQAASTRCETCGAAFQDIVNDGKVGCANCYTLYRDNLMPTIQRIHGNINHTGKVPASMGTKAVLKNEIDSLKRKLQEAIKIQDFENAAKLRDQIKEKEKEAESDE